MNDNIIIDDIIPDKSPIMTCKTCGSSDITSIDGEMICTECSTYIGSTIDESQEWRFTDSGFDQSRCSLFINDLMPDSSYGSYISSKSFKYRRMQKIQKSQSTPQNERSLRKQLDKLSNKSFERGIPDSIRERAEVLYTYVLESQKDTGKTAFRGNNSDGLLFGGALKQAFIEAGCPRNHTELASIAGIDGHYITRGDNMFNELMSKRKGRSYQKKVLSYIDYIDSFCEKLGITDIAIRNEIKQVADRSCENALLEDKNPTSIAAGCIFFVQYIYSLGIHKTKIADETSVSCVTINKVNGALMNNIGMVLCD